MANQCNTCGSYDDLILCAHCKVTALCQHCRKNHEPYCEKNQKLIRAGGGATIANIPQAPHRHGHETPEDVRTPAPERVISKPAVAPEELRSDIMYHAAKSIEANHELLQRLADEAPAEVSQPLVEGIAPAAEPVDQGTESISDKDHYLSRVQAALEGVADLLKSRRK